MKKYIIIALFAIFCTPVFAQKPYFQQEVHYKIAVTLNDQQHSLSGNIAIEYVNHSPDQLEFIYLHLWGNAYQHRNTAFAQQHLRIGNTKFYFAQEADLGGFSGLDFGVDGQKANLEIQKDNPDIAILHLPKALESGKSITITSPFQLRIPASFSRLGHVGESYQITQWHPKPAVYDAAGWHPMPYLDMGEFYAEFGSYDVTITLPDNYLVGATGELQTASERLFLEKKVAESTQLLNGGSAPPAWSQVQEDSFPPSSKTMKTIRYRADKVHDFAWFADKRFLVQKSEVLLASGRKVDTWAMFTNTERNLWKQATQYLNRAVKFYSDAVGEYPYPQMTAVQSALSAGAGMEYPMITVIGTAWTPKDLDIVITHEVGHNWFYGILASNERDHAWMDEGINSYYEKRYTKQYYKEADDFADIPNFIRRGSEMTTNELVYLFQARRNLDQAPASHSDDFTATNYLLSAYEKPALAFAHLEQYLGIAKFDAAMQSYFREWQFKHPQPADLRQIIEKETAENLHWLFEGLLYSNAKLDYAIAHLEKSADSLRLTIKNKGKVAAPFVLQGMKEGQIVFQQWHPGFDKKQDIFFPKGDYDRLTLDAERILLDINRKNNHIKPSGSKVEPFQLRFLPGPEDDKRTQFFWSPAMAWNQYDKYMLGLVLYNTTLPFKNLDFTLLPMYSFANNSVLGLADVQLHLYPRSKLVQSVALGLGARRFHFDQNFKFDYQLQYTRLVPSLTVELGKKPASNFYQQLQWRAIVLNQEFPQFGSLLGNFIGKKQDNTVIHEWRYSGENRRKLHPFSFLLALEQQTYEDNFDRKQRYLKASLEWKSSFTYQSDKNIRFRFFAGGFITNTRREAGAIFPGAFNLTAQGFNDYRFDDYYFGRTEGEGIWSQQITIRDGGMKNTIGDGFSLGRSNNYVLAFNMIADLPGKMLLRLPLKPYFDIGYFDNAMPTGASDTFEDQLLWSGGIALEFIQDIAAIYFPIINSKNIQDRYAERGNYWKRIAFTLDLRKLNPKELIKKLDIGN